MTRKLPDSLIYEAVERYKTVQSMTKVSAELGVDSQAIMRGIRRLGIELPADFYRSSTRQPTPPDLAERYSDGASVLELSKRYGVGRNVVTRWLRESGIRQRSASEQGKIHMATLTPEQRRAKAAAAHDAVRGVPYTRQARLSRARTVFERCRRGDWERSHLELQLGEWLTDRGVDFIPEQVVDCHNVDFGIAPVAVELLGGSWHATPARREYHAQRTHEILNAGWSMIFVWSTHYLPINPWAADKIVTLLEEARRNPSPISQYWVIRGDGQLSAHGGDEGDNFTLVLPSQASARRWP